MLASGDVADITVGLQLFQRPVRLLGGPERRSRPDAERSGVLQGGPNAKKFGPTSMDTWQVPSDYGNASGAKWSSGQNLMINKSCLEKLASRFRRPGMT